MLDETHLSPGIPEPQQEYAYRSGDRPLDGYTIKRGLGSGGFGEVYYAVSDGGKEVALKLVRRYLDVEMRGVIQCLNLKSPNLITIYDVRTNPKGEQWIVMEYLGGKSLGDIVKDTQGPMPVAEALRWLRGIAKAIDDLHEHGIVHRDLKPGNVFSEGSLVKVGDYGLSKFISNSRRSGQTQSIGTVHYMAPEISTGNYGRSVDIYSAAVMAFEMLSGDVPFDGETAGEILMKHLTAEPMLDKVDARYRPVFAKALAKNPVERFQSVLDLHDALAVAAGLASANQQNGTINLANPEVIETPANKPKPRVISLEQSIPPLPGTINAKRRSMSDVLWSMFVAGCTCSISAMVLMSADMVINNRSAPDVAGFLIMAVLGSVGTWGLLILNNVWTKAETDTVYRRINAMNLGLAIGALALILNIYLGRVPSLAKFVTSESVLTDKSFREVLPSLVIYLSVFGLCFAVPDWFTQTQLSRYHRFVVWPAMWIAAVGLVIGNIVSRPGAGSFGLSGFWLAGTMAMTSMVVQWISPHKRRLPLQARRQRLGA